MNIKPAYGRTYKSVDDVMKDWDANIDFKVWNGPYLNKRNWEKYGSPLDSIVYEWGNIKVYIQLGLVL